MRAERPILLRFLNVLTSLNDFIIKRIVFLFLVKYIASGTLKHNMKSKFCVGGQFKLVEPKNFYKSLSAKNSLHCQRHGFQITRHTCMIV